MDSVSSIRTYLDQILCCAYELSNQQIKHEIQGHKNLKPTPSNRNINLLKRTDLVESNRLLSGQLWPRRQKGSEV